VFEGYFIGYLSEVGQYKSDNTCRLWYINFFVSEGWGGNPFYYDKHIVWPELRFILDLTASFLPNTQSEISDRSVRELGSFSRNSTNKREQ
jgi:hypothetical protein